MLSQAELRRAKVKGVERLVGRVRCAALHQQPLRHLLLILRNHARQDEAKGLPHHNAILPLEFHETSSGWLELDAELPADIRPGSRALLRLEAYLSWPQPRFYQISNDLPFALPDAP